MDQAKRDKDLALVQDLLVKWRHLAYAELTDPGSYFRVFATAEHTLATGQPPPGSVSGDKMTATAGPIGDLLVAGAAVGGQIGLDSGRLLARGAVVEDPQKLLGQLWQGPGGTGTRGHPPTLGFRGYSGFASTHTHTVALGP